MIKEEYMKKVVIYGVKNSELRKDIEFFLDDNYKIVGYSDTYFMSSGIDGMPFIPPCQLCHWEFDYILLAAQQKAARMEIRQSLLSYGIPIEKVIEPMILLRKNAEKCTLDLIEDIRCHYRGECGLIFGLSYSRKGICKKELKMPFYDCSLPGLDLYYNLRVYTYMVEKGLLANLKLVLFVFPYNYFVYDMSKSFAQYESGQIFAIRQLNDWHHYEQVEGAKDYVESYRMFGKKIARQYCSCWYDVESPYPYRDNGRKMPLENLWFAEYEETAIENEMLFSEFCLKLKRGGVNPVLVIPPVYLEGIDQASYNAFLEKKEHFYHVVHKTEKKAGKLKVFDYADRFANQPDFFRDLTHLNTMGREKFTNLINTEIL